MENKEYETLINKCQHYKLALEYFKNYTKLVFEKNYKTEDKLSYFRKNKNTLPKEELFKLVKDITNEFWYEANELTKHNFVLKEDGYIYFNVNDKGRVTEVTENEYDDLVNKNYHYSLSLEGCEDYINFIFKKVSKTLEKLECLKNSEEENKLNLVKEIISEFEFEIKNLNKVDFDVEDIGYVEFLSNYEKE